MALIYTNDLPEVVHEEECEKNGLKKEEPHFNTVCEDCGAIVSFADDTTDTVTDPDPIQLNLKLSRKYNNISEYFTNNRLKVNDSKTHLIIMATEQKRRTLQENICINLPEDTIYPTESERLLGIQIHQSLKWREYIMFNDNSLLKSLNTRINALQKIKTIATFKTRLMIGNGIFSSKLLFGIQLYGGTEEYLLSALQTAMNKAARAITRRGRETPTRELLRQVGWLSVRQMVFYHSVLLVYKVRQYGYPMYFAEKLSEEYVYNTRNSQDNVIRMGQQFRAKNAITTKSWRWRGAINFNKLPSDIRCTEGTNIFKMKLRIWVMNNIAIK